MGLIKMAKETIESLLADQWREYFYCDAMPSDILVKKGQKRANNSRSNKSSGDIISNGSVIAVNEGQCMLIVDQGGVVDLCAVAGEFVYDASSEPSLFYGDLGENVKDTFDTLFHRLSFGGGTGKDQRIYYINLLEIMDNLFGTANPMPFLYVDDNIGIELEVEIKFNGTYSFRITDPLLFYKNVCGNVQDVYETSRLRNTMKAELMQAMQPALAKLGDLRIRVSDITKHTLDLTEELNRQLSVKWAEIRGIEVVSLNMNAPTMSQDMRDKINNVQLDAVYRDEDMRKVKTAEALSKAMVAAAGNSAGTERGTMGMGMAMMMGDMMGEMMGGNIHTVLGNAGSQDMQQNIQRGMPQNMQPGMTQNMSQDMQQGMPQMRPAGAAPVPGWTCKCGYEDNRGKFCQDCGSPKPAEAGWTCSCGAVNQGKFCPDCGSKRPEGAPIYKCDKCGWEPEDPTNPPKFCPECGDIFDDNDRV